MNDVQRQLLAKQWREREAAKAERADDMVWPMPTVDEVVAAGYPASYHAQVEADHARIVAAWEADEPGVREACRRQREEVLRDLRARALEAARECRRCGLERPDDARGWMSERLADVPAGGRQLAYLMRATRDPVILDARAWECPGCSTRPKTEEKR